MVVLRTQTDTLARGALDGLAARHRAFANNIANVETPGFTPRDVPFEEQLKRIRDESETNRLGTEVAPEPTLSLEPTPMEQTAGRADGNGVQIDEQVMRLEENRITYEALIQATHLRHEILLSVVTETPR